jgi:hypothetical protein
MVCASKPYSSTTMNYPELKKGAEPDNAYYIQNQPLVKGRNVDFASDPAPDLVVEEDEIEAVIALRHAILARPERLD